MPRDRLAALFAAAFLAAGASAQPTRGAELGNGARETIVLVPETLPEGGTVLLYTRLCRPPGPGPFRIVVINHGTAIPVEAEEPTACGSEVAQWFLARDFMVVSPMRPGFGASSGPLRESSGSCDDPHYVAAGLAGAQDIAAVVAYATALPDARRDHAVVLGQSTGGWATLAYDSLPHPRVDALISMAGGRGGYAYGAAGLVCRPDLLTAAVFRLAENATTPMLWIYARNDSFFPPAIAESLYAAWLAGGAKATLVQPPAYGSEGHDLLRGPGGSRVWGPAVESYLRQRAG